MYSTCTFNQLENEDQISRLLAEGSFELVSWNAPSACVPGRSMLGHYFLPGTTESEGLYIAVLRKKGPVVINLAHNDRATSKNTIFDISLTEEIIFAGKFN